MVKSPKFIAVIGASAGGLDALAEMVHHLETDLDVAYCIVLHLSHTGIGDFVVHRMSQSTSMHCSLATDGAAIKKNNIYIARPDQHLLVKNGKFILGAGPEENRFRPSIDVLFRSAAVAHGSNAIGIILSGMLDDGTSGMCALKRSGGVCIVQDPNEAEYPDMPLSVINNMDVDHSVQLDQIGPLVGKIIRNGKRKKKSAPADVVAESMIAETTAIGISDVAALGEKSVFACPDCGSNLWEIGGDTIKRYRCHIGHAYTERDLVIKQAETAGATLWVALRMMEERKHLLKKMEIESAKKGHKSISQKHAEKHDELQRHIEKLKKILFDLQNHSTG